ncbi:nicotinate phosphoribosyltransferase 2-like [Rutidosis leptorrhynchoides]|uniref:nicotinate phosphoribosyltransferase 2-like n=1 Tax=Rutidosis leptorrhynchoides TaxID=125765 RepID=UPI003A9A487B
MPSTIRFSISSSVLLQAVNRKAKGFCANTRLMNRRDFSLLQRVEELMKCYWPGSADKAREELPTLKQIRDHCMKQLEQMQTDHMRRLNPTPYKVSVSTKLYELIQFLWLNNLYVCVVHELCFRFYALQGYLVTFYR